MRVAIVVGFVCASLATIASLAACLVTIDESKIRHEDGDAAIGDAGSDVTFDAPTDAFDGGCPPLMVKVPIADSGAHYCIDETETTLDEYGAFVDAADPPAPGSQRAECAWNATYKPPGWGSGTTGKRAVGGLDWCDAFAYCAWAGKRLCGRIGGGAVDPNGGATSALEGQWFSACTRGGTRVYPYGDTYDAGACIGRDTFPTPQGPAQVGTATCTGGYEGIFDMSGNVEEFIDSCLPEKLCDGGPECDLCLMLGGGYMNRSGDLVCAYENQVLRKGQYEDNGVRCCWP